MEEKYKGGFTVCPYPPKYIVYNRPNKADYDHCLLKPRNSILMGSVKSNGSAIVFQICGQQKLVKE